ncbi:hypothetical protein FOA52_004829 [Chlamydomonas sp. UWO 241]|nr:hypothetical protein FOA52_004829 [Chlamydomonas sp. UWO 241]
MASPSGRGEARAERPRVRGVYIPKPYVSSKQLEDTLGVFKEENELLGRLLQDAREDARALKARCADADVQLGAAHAARAELEGVVLTLNERLACAERQLQQQQLQQQQPRHDGHGSQQQQQQQQQHGVHHGPGPQQRHHGRSPQRGGAPGPAAASSSRGSPAPSPPPSPQRPPFSPGSARAGAGSAIGEGAATRSELAKQKVRYEQLGRQHKVEMALLQEAVERARADRARAANKLRAAAQQQLGAIKVAAAEEVSRGMSVLERVCANQLRLIEQLERRVVAAEAAGARMTQV